MEDEKKVVKKSTTSRKTATKKTPTTKKTVTKAVTKKETIKKTTTPKTGKATAVKKVSSLKKDTKKVTPKASTKAVKETKILEDNLLSTNNETKEITKEEIIDLVEKNNIEIPDLKGYEIKEALKELDKLGIEYEKETIKKLTLFDDKGTVSKIEEKDGKAVIYESSGKMLMWLVLIPVLAALGLGLTFGSGIFDSIQDQIINTGLKAPEIELDDFYDKDGNPIWTKENILKVKNPSKKLDHYKYCIRKENEECEWKETKEPNIVIPDSGHLYVTIIPVDKDGKEGKKKEAEIYVDNNDPQVNKLNVVKVTQTTIEVSVEAVDNESGIDSYLYSLDGINYTTGDTTYLFNNLTPNTEYTVYVKVKDKVGNETVVSMKVRTLGEEKEIVDELSEEDEYVTIELNYPDGSTNRQWTIDGTTWEDYEGPIKVKKTDVEKIKIKYDLNGSTITQDKDGKELEKIDWDLPIINLDDVPSKFPYGDIYELPSFYDFGNDDGEVICLVDGEEEVETSKLKVGKHIIECSATSNHGKIATVDKEIEVLIGESEDKIEDGWIKLNLYYPEESYDREWILKKPGTYTTGDNGWQEYVGPILVQVDDIENIFIRYMIDGQEYVVSYGNRVVVDIYPSSYELWANTKTRVRIEYEKGSYAQQYKINDGEWQEYTGSFEVGPDTYIQARATKVVKVYDENGDYLFDRKEKGTDAVYISLYTPPTHESYSGSGSGSNGSGGSGGGNEAGEVTQPGTGSTPMPKIEELEGPIISEDPAETLTEEAFIMIDTLEEASIIYYKEETGGYKEYKGPFTVDKNQVISAYYIRKSDGMVSKTTVYEVKNIYEPELPYVRIDAAPAKYLTETQNSVEVTISGSNYDTLEYSLDGVMYFDYTAPLTVTQTTTVYAKGTNDVGETIETLLIPTKTPPKILEDLTIEIASNPKEDETGILHDSAEITIYYDVRAEKKYYSVGESGWQEYTGPFTIYENTTIKAYATSENGRGEAELGIGNLTTGIAAPKIVLEPSTEKVNTIKVSIEYAKNANVKEYKIGKGDWQTYTGDFYVKENTIIYARCEDVLHHTAKSSKVIKNIFDPLILDEGSYYLIRLNYPDGVPDDVKEYQWKTTGTWKTYDPTGILLIKQEYFDELEKVGEDGIKVKDSKGNEVIVTDHWYVLDCPISDIMDYLSMRWESGGNISVPTITLSTTEPTEEVTVGITYKKDVIKKMYKIIYEDGESTDWLEYTGTFKIDKQNTIIFARGINQNGKYTKSVSKQITNIDHEDPTLEIKGNTTKPRRRVNLSVYADDDQKIHVIRYASGSHDTDYFNEEKQAKGKDISNNSIVRIEENGIYTFYVVDKAGHEVIKEVEITNIDKTAPDLEINVLEESTQVEAKVEIVTENYTNVEYSIGSKDNYQPYTSVLTLSAYDYAELKNSDGSLTIYAKGIDLDNQEIEVEETIYTLDLDIPNKPEIKAYELYPRLTEDEFSVKTTQEIIYDKRIDVVNDYSIDGENYQVYQGPMELSNVTITARTRKPESGITVTSQKTIKVENDMLQTQGYDKDMNTVATVAQGTSQKFILSNELEGRSVRIYTNNTPAANAQLKIYDFDGNLIETLKVEGPVTVFKVPENGYKVEIVAGSSALEIKEVELRDVREEITEDVLPIITIDTPNWSVDKEVTITYPAGYINEYSIDNGDNWLEYTNSFTLDENLTVIARVRDGNSLLGASTFKITTIDNDTPRIEMWIPSTISIDYNHPLPSEVKFGKSGKKSIICTANSVEVVNSNDLPLGENEVVCIAESKSGMKYTVSKTITVVNVSDLNGDSLLSVLSNNDIVPGKYGIDAYNEHYDVHTYVYDGPITWTKENVPYGGIFGDASDVASGTTEDKMATRMVIVRVNGDLTIEKGVTIKPYSSTYGGPKGFLLQVTGKLTNNGTIDNSHGAYAKGQDVYLWKNAITDDFELIPKEGATGAGGRYGCCGDSSGPGFTGNSGSGRQTAGGGSGSLSGGGTSGVGGRGTSYSGGPGGGTNRDSLKDGSNDGGYGGAYEAAGNPSGGTGGLLVIFANEYENKGTLTARGSSSPTNYRGASGGGSINIITNQDTEINELGVVTNTRYTEILGNVAYNGGSNLGSGNLGGAGGTGTVNIGEIRNGQYYDLKDIINQDIDAYVESVTRRGESILSILENYNLGDGYYFFEVNATVDGVEKTEKYPVHIYTYDEDQIWTKDNVPYGGIFGNKNDISQDIPATSTTAAYRSYAQNMVIVRVNGDLTVEKDVTLTPYSSNYGGPKGFMLYVTGTLTNKGIIDNSHGAYAKGQDVYLWKNVKTNDYEVIPAAGAGGAGGRYGCCGDSGGPGFTGGSGSGRQTAGGGSGSLSGGGTSGVGGRGTSYSGGPGGATNRDSSKDGSNEGGPGGANVAAGNPNGGTGGLLIIYANGYENSGKLTANGHNSPSGGKGSSGGGSINIFTNQSTGITELGVNVNSKYNEMLGTTQRNGGSSVSNGGAGGTGTVNIGEIRDGQYYDLKQIIEQDLDALRVHIYSTYTYPSFNGTTLKDGYYTVKITMPEGYERIVYTLDNGTTWLDYTEEFKLSSAQTIKAKAYRIDDSVSELATLVMPAVTDYLPSLTATIPANKSNTFTLSSGNVLDDTIGNSEDVSLEKILRLYTENEPSDTATIKLFDKDGNELVSDSVSKITVVHIPNGAYKVTIFSGTKELVLTDINTIDRQDIEVDIPEISIHTTEWSTTKTITIYYPTGNINEYSLDGGETWETYQNYLVVDKPVTVIARTRTEEGNVLSASSFNITKVDSVEPEILMQMPSTIAVDYDMPIPTNVTFGISGKRSVVCTLNGEEIDNTKDLPLGTNEVTCKAVSVSGMESTVTKVINVVVAGDLTGDSLLSVLDNNTIVSGKFGIDVYNEHYDVHTYVYYGNQNWTTETVPNGGVFGDASDVASGTSSSQMATRMVIVRVEGDLTIGEGVTVKPYSGTYGGPKGFLLQVTGKLENKGTIDNSHGAYALGQDVYLWKNAITNDYELVPKAGVAGAARTNAGGGSTPSAATGRQTGGGAAGGGGGGGFYGGAGSAGTSYSGGTGGGGNSQWSSPSGASPNGGSGGSPGYGGGGAGNPGVSGGSNGTGGLLIIYAEGFKNDGNITAVGSSGGGGAKSGGGSGGGSINIFTNQDTGINQLGIVTNARYNEILGATQRNGGGGITGGTGTVNIGEIREGQYYDLKDIIEQDIASYIESITKRGESILSILDNNNLPSGYYFFEANGEKYPVHIYTYNGNQDWTTSNVPNGGIFGDKNDVSQDIPATSTTAAYRSYAQNMVIVRVNGDLTVENGVTIQPYSTSYGGPKGFLLQVTGKLTNNGIIDNSHGAYAVGQDVYLWKNAITNDYELVPKAGVAGAARTNSGSGVTPPAATGRQTGGGAAGIGGGGDFYGGAGSAGTSYSGGTGGGGNSQWSSPSGASPNGGSGGSPGYGSGGAGNPGVSGGSNGTGGLLIIYSDGFENNGKITALGANGGTSNAWRYGGSSGGGSINIFTNQDTGINQLGVVVNTKYSELLGTTSMLGGQSGIKGGTGTVNIGEIRNGQYYDLHDIIDQDKDALRVHIYSEYTYPVFDGTDLTEGYYTITITKPSDYERIVYTLDNGATWLDYIQKFVLNESATIKAKAIRTDGSESQVETLTVEAVNDYLPSVSSTIPANTSKSFIISTVGASAGIGLGDEKGSSKIVRLSNEQKNNLEKVIRIYTENEPSENASVKLYDISDNELISSSMDEVTTVHIPNNAYKVTIFSGNSQLVLSDIDITERDKIDSEIPQISIDTANWSLTKNVTIDYPEGYVNEYSIDNGENWYVYEDSIVVDNPVTVIARTITNDGTVISASSFTITKVDTTEPTIELDIPEEFGVGTSYSLPTSYSVDNSKSGGSALCMIGEDEVNSTANLEAGEYEIICTVTTGAGKEKNINKTVTVLEKYTITFDYQVEGINNETIEVLDGSGIGSLPTKDREGFTLSGWYTNTDYDTEISENTVPTGTTTYYAKWEENTVSYILKDKIISAANGSIYTNPTLDKPSYYCEWNSETSQNECDFINDSGLYSINVTNGFGGQSSEGTTYYFRGNVDNNVVRFADMLWRIVRINEDGTVRLILDNSIDENTYAYNSVVSGFDKMYYSNSEIKDTLVDWYEENISKKGYNGKVATGNYFCEAAENRQTGNQSGVNANMTHYYGVIQNLECNNDGNKENGYGLVSSNIGLLTSKEAIFAGNFYQSSNEHNYLYSGINHNNSYNWWVMSPSGMEGGDSGYSTVWRFNSSGGMQAVSASNSSRIRPVINLKADTRVTVDENGYYVVQ